VPRKNQSFVVTGEDLPTGCQLPDFGANFKVVLMKMNVVLQEDRGAADANILIRVALAFATLVVRGLPPKMSGKASRPKKNHLGKILYSTFSKSPVT
jgi:hypothetical protein